MLVEQGCCTKPFWAVRIDTEQFLSKKRDTSEAERYLEFLDDHDQMCVVAFSADFHGVLQYSDLAREREDYC